VENAPNLKSHGVKLSSIPFPACAETVFRSDEYWKCLTRHITRTLYHPVGTVSMGKIGSSVKAVLDSELRVFGIKNLRVIDASIMPGIPSMNIHSATIMVAERGAEFVKEAWK